MLDRETRDAQVHDWLEWHLPEGTAEAVSECEAFGALATNLARQAGDDPQRMEQILVETFDSLDASTLEWIAEADAPAGFIANRVKRLLAEAEQDMSL